MSYNKETSDSQINELVKFAEYSGKILSEIGPPLCETIETSRFLLSHNKGTSDSRKNELDKLAKYSG